MNVGRVKKNNNRDYCNYKDRIIADSGLCKNDVNTLDYINFLRSIGVFDSLKLYHFGESGYKKRTSTIYNYATKLYDASIDANNIIQATELSQPFLGGNISPVEKQYLKFTAANAKKMTFTEVAFSATDKWTFSTYVDLTGSNQTSSSIIGRGSDTASNVFVRHTSINRFSFMNESGTLVHGTTGGTNSLYGKKSLISFVAEGDGTLKIYKNGTLYETLTVATNFKYSQIGSGFSTTGLGLNGNVFSYLLNNNSLTATQLTAIFNFLRVIYPDISSVTIGTQIWSSSNWDAVITPVGNVIPNVTVSGDWSNSTVLYTNAYNAASGTTAQKEYSGYMAAAMWCYYNNDPIVGSVYGKLYNWYAVRLFDLDFATAGFMWHVPTQAEFTTLVNYLGGVSVSGGKLKMTGIDYINTPNTGATNLSGFTFIIGGQRITNGIFLDFMNYQRLWTITQNDISSSYALRCDYNGESITLSSVDKRTGYALRLLKN